MYSKRVVCSKYSLIVSCLLFPWKNRYRLDCYDIFLTVLFDYPQYLQSEIVENVLSKGSSIYSINNAVRHWWQNVLIYMNLCMSHICAYYVNFTLYVSCYWILPAFTRIICWLFVYLQRLDCPGKNNKLLRFIDSLTIIYIGAGRKSSVFF